MRVSPLTRKCTAALFYRTCPFVQKQKSTVFWAEICVTFSPNKRDQHVSGLQVFLFVGSRQRARSKPEPESKTANAHLDRRFSVQFGSRKKKKTPQKSLTPRTRNKGPRSEAPLRKHTQTRSGDEVRSPRQLFSPDNLTFIWGVYP